MHIIAKVIALWIITYQLLHLLVHVCVHVDTLYTHIRIYTFMHMHAGIFETHCFVLKNTYLPNKNQHHDTASFPNGNFFL